MCPSEGGDVGQKLWAAVETVALSRVDRVAEVFCIPVDDDRGEEVEARHPIVLPLGSTIPDFALAANAPVGALPKDPAHMRFCTRRWILCKQSSPFCSNTQVFWNKFALTQ